MVQSIPFIRCKKIALIKWKWAEVMRLLTIFVMIATTFLSTTHPWNRHGHIGDGDDDVRVALVVPSSAVSYVVDPLPVVLQMS